MGPTGLTTTGPGSAGLREHQIDDRASKLIEGARLPVDRWYRTCVFVVHWWCRRRQLLTALGNNPQLSSGLQVTATTVVTSCRLERGTFQARRSEPQWPDRALLHAPEVAWGQAPRGLAGPCRPLRRRFGPTLATGALTASALASSGTQSGASGSSKRVTRTSPSSGPVPGARIRGSSPSTSWLTLELSLVLLGLGPGLAFRAHHALTGCDSEGEAKALPLP